MREIRCFAGGGAAPLNSWAGTSAEADVRTFWTLRAVLEGPIDAKTGYLCDIKAIDAVLRRMVGRRLASVALDGQGGLAALGSALQAGFAEAAADCPRPADLSTVELRLSPHTSLAASFRTPRASVGPNPKERAGEARHENTPMIHLTQSFEFAAAHRLACEGFSDAENARLFGKCSNPHGHGHNYLLEVTVAGEIDDRAGTVVDLPRLDRAVRERVIEPFDHKNLNVECPDFARLNPTVENIAKVIFDRLRTAVEPARLTRVRVWETAKTYAECAG